MRKVVLYMRTTLDGYACGPNGELDWMFRQPTGPDQEAALTQFQREVGTTLLHTTGGVLAQPDRRAS